MPSLDWTNRERDLTAAARTAYRLLKPVASMSCGKGSENMLIEGDNLEALKALQPYIGGQVKCVFIDPPYNTNQDFDHYRDSLKHSQWLSIMYPRLELLRDLLRKDGSLWVTLDDEEAHYFKVIADEIFGRENFVADITWQKKYTVANDAKHFSTQTDHVFVYAKDKEHFKVNRIARSALMDSRYKNPDKHRRGPWKATPLHAKSGSAKGERFSYTFKNGVTWSPPVGTYPRFSKDTLKAMDDGDEIWFGKNGMAVPSRKTFLEEVSSGGGVVPSNLWSHEDAGNNHLAKDEVRAIVPEDPFKTPKPERLMQRIIDIATKSGDLVLDSFLGSGTTAAVAHKMGRRWVGVEMGEHARTHCVPRLKKVIEGEQGGVSRNVGWEGGGGFTFYTLGERMFDDNEQINPAIGFAALASHIIFSETGKATTRRQFDTPLIGEHEGSAYYLLYNGILGEKSAKGGNVLTKAILKGLPAFDGPKIIYGEACLIPEEQHEELGIVFRMTPYSIKGR